MFRTMSWWCVTAVSAVVLISTATLTSTSAASAAERASGSAGGVWPGVGQICGKGPGGASNVRGVEQGHPRRRLHRRQQHGAARMST